MLRLYSTRSSSPLVTKQTICASWLCVSPSPVEKNTTRVGERDEAEARGPSSPTRRGAAPLLASAPAVPATRFTSSAGSAGNGPPGPRNAVRTQRQRRSRSPTRPTRAREDTAAHQVILQMLADMRLSPGRKRRRRLPVPRRGPMPDSISRCGEPMAPALRMTSLLCVRRSRFRPSRCGIRRRWRSVRPSSRRITRVACAPVMIVRLGRRSGLALEERLIGAGSLAARAWWFAQRDDAGSAAAIASVVVAARDARGHGGFDEIARAPGARGSGRRRPAGRRYCARRRR